MAGCTAILWLSQPGSVVGGGAQRGKAGNNEHPLEQFGPISGHAGKAEHAGDSTECEASY